MRQSKANVLEVADGCSAALPAIQAALPAGVELHMAFDGSVFVQRSISEAKETLLITAALVILIIFLFLATLRATIIPALAIPVSIVATFAIIGAFGYSVNTLTLLGLILAIGIVVDDAIIVMENAYRHQEELHKDPRDGGNRWHARDHYRRDRDDHLPARCFLAAPVPHRRDGSTLQRVRRGRRRIRSDLRASSRSR